MTTNTKCIRLLFWTLSISVILVTCSKEKHKPIEYESTVQGDIPTTVSHGSVSAERLVFRLFEVIRIRQDPSNQASLLFRPSRCLRDAKGTLYVLDDGNCRIAVFDENGIYVRSFGRQGAGPGEFEGMSFLRFTGDMISIWDPRLRRTTQYMKDGTLIAVRRAPSDSASTGSNPTCTAFLPIRDDWYLTWHREFSTNRGIQSTRQSVRIHLSDTTVLSEVSTDFAPVGMARGRSQISGVTEGLIETTPFTGSPSVVLTPSDDLLVIAGDSAELSWYSLTGELLRRARLDPLRRPFTVRMRRDLMDELEAIERQSALTQRRDADPITVPPLPESVGFTAGGVVVDDYGYIWLRGVWGPGELGTDRPTITSSLPTYYPWHVFAPDGRYLGVCNIPGLEASISDGHASVITFNPESGEFIPTVFRIIGVSSLIDYPGAN
jgi:hypothetical protein